MAKFDMGEFAKTLKTEVSKLDTDGRDQIQYLDIDQLDDDPGNFYSVDQLNDLAANIELCGLQQPIRVRAGESGRYTIVSGHRRRAALRKLVEDGKVRYRDIPCIVEHDETISPAMRELRLIYANADTRVLSSADIAKQAERVAALLYQLKEEGVEFPGRMRDHVAEACKVSKSKLARLSAIRKNMIPLWGALYEKNEIAEDLAYELSKLPEDYQRKLYDAKSTVSICGYDVNRLHDELKALDAIQCPKGEQCCLNADRMWERMLKKSDYSSKNCDGTYGRTAKCCKDCQQLYTCKFACEKFADKIAKYKAEAKNQKKEDKAAQQAESEAKLERAMKSWARFAEIRRNAKIKTVDFVNAVFQDANKYNQSWRVERWTAYQAGKEISSNTVCFPYLLSFAELIRAADVLHCSTDYLLGRADDPQPFDGAWKSVQDETPDIGRFLFVCDSFGCVQASVFWNGKYMDSTPVSVGNHPLDHIQLWMYQPALPEGRKHAGQVTLESMMKDRGVQ